VTLKQRKLENAPGVTTPVTSANKTLIDAVTVSIAANSSQQLTPTGLELVAAAASVANFDRWAAAGTSDLMAWRWMASYDGSGTADAFGATRVLFFGMSTTTAANGSGTAPWKARFPASGNMAWQDFANTTIPLVSGAHAPLPNVDYDYSVIANRATGTITITAYSAAGAPLATWTKSNANLGADPFYGMEADAPTEIGTTRIHKQQMDDGRATEIPAWVDAPNQAPTASYDAARTTVAAGGTVSSTLTGTDPDGTITAYEQAIDTASAAGATLTGTTSATSTLTASVPAGTLITLKGRVRDDAGAYSAYVPKEICVPTTAPAVTPLPTTTGGFIRNGSQPSDGAALGSSNDADNMETPAALTSTPQTITVRAQPMVTRSGTLAVVSRARKVGTSGTMTVRLLQGTVNKGTLAAVALTDTFTNYQLDLTAAAVDAITDWSNVYVAHDFTA
jgi:hypothetical protein